MPYRLLAALLLLSIASLYTLSWRSSSKTVSPKLTCTIEHLGVIMDGNRRWARAHKVSAAEGYKRGTDALHTTIDCCIAHRIPLLSVYAFSLENFQRNQEETTALFNQFAQEAQTALPQFTQRGVAVRFVGDRDKFPESLNQTIKTIEEQTAQGKALQLNILFCYGGRQEIIAAIKKIIQKVQDGEIRELPEEEEFKKYLWANDSKDPDLVIRTGGCKRLSNFMPYQTIYSELHFLNKLWPDITKNDLEEAFNDYMQRSKTTFGK